MKALKRLANQDLDNAKAWGVNDIEGGFSVQFNHTSKEWVVMDKSFNIRIRSDFRDALVTFLVDHVY
jgi:hypothetical protein